MYSLLLKVDTELKENKRRTPNKMHLNICQEKQPSPKDNFKPRGKPTMYVNQHFTDASTQNPSITRKMDIHTPSNYIRVHHSTVN